MTELSLDISQRDISQYDLEASVELKPDVCAYRKRPVVPAGKNDLIKVSQMPDKTEGALAVGLPLWQSGA